MKKALSLLLITVLALTVAACGGQGAGSGKTYIVGTDAAYAPFEWVEPSGEIVGFDIEVLKAIAEEEGITLQFENTAWDGIFLTLDSGERDLLISAITITDERKETMDFTGPYFEATQLIAVPAGSDVTKFEDLKGKKVAVQTGTTGDLIVSELLGATSGDIYRYESTPLALQEMVNQGVDAVVADNVVVLEYIKNNPDKNFASINDDSFPKEFYGMAVKKGNQELLDILNNGLQTIKDNGKYEEIFNKYFVN
jgi:ABC-type amino acid transport substrate-binding protein